MIAKLAKLRHEDNPEVFCLTEAEAFRLAGQLAGLVIDRNKRPASVAEIYQSMRNGECKMFGTDVRVY